VLCAADGCAQYSDALLFWRQGLVAHPCSCSKVLCIWGLVPGFVPNACLAAVESDARCFMQVVSMSRFHPSSLNNFLRSSCFNIEFSLSPMCPSISCIHIVSYVGFLHWPLHHFLRFYCFNTGTAPCVHLVSVSKIPPTLCQVKKTCTGSSPM